MLVLPAYPDTNLYEAGVHLLGGTRCPMIILVEAYVCSLGGTQYPMFLLVETGVSLLGETPYPLILLVEADIRSLVCIVPDILSNLSIF